MPALLHRAKSLISLHFSWSVLSSRQSLLKGFDPIGVLHGRHVPLITLSFCLPTLSCSLYLPRQATRWMSCAGMCIYTKCWCHFVLEYAGLLFNVRHALNILEMSVFVAWKCLLDANISMHKYRFRQTQIPLQMHLHTCFRAVMLQRVCWCRSGAIALMCPFLLERNFKFCPLLWPLSHTVCVSWNVCLGHSASFSCHFMTEFGIIWFINDAKSWIQQCISHNSVFPSLSGWFEVKESNKTWKEHARDVWPPNHK